MNTYTNSLAIWLKELLVITALMVSTNAIAQEHIGRVIHTSGELVAENGSETRALMRGSNIAEGDTIRSGARTRSQLRMSDGALIVLRQNTEINFEAYGYDENDVSVSRSIFSLIRGGFKTISGLIGKHNKKDYKVKTAFTTMGIRGTNYGLTICDQDSCSDGSGGTLKDGLYASVIDGEIYSENAAGYYTFSNDEYFYIAEPGGEPQSLLKAPGVVFGYNSIEGAPGEQSAGTNYASLLTDSILNPGASVHTNVNMQNETLDNGAFTPFFAAGGDANNNTYMVLSSPGDTMMFGYFQGDSTSLTPVTQTLVDDGTVNNQFILNAIAAENGELIPLASRITFGTGPTTRFLYLTNITVADTGSATIGGTNVSWGRWNGDLYESSDDGSLTSHSGSLHYAAAEGGLTTPAQIGAMTGTFNYSTVGGTRATDLSGNVAASVADVNMSVDFGLQNIDGFSVATSVGGIDYQAELAGGPTPINTAIDTGMPLMGNPGGVCPTCGGQASLGFVGAQAEGAITNYNIGNAGASTTITGSAILER